MLSVVCPVYDEAENIGHLMENIQSRVTTPMELLVVYDSEEDNTIPAVKAIASRFAFEIKLVQNKYGKGVLNAIKTGLEAAPGEAVLVIMADLSDDLSIVDRMYHLLIGDGYDIVCGSRYMKGGRHIGGPKFKKLLSRMAGVTLYLLTGIPTHDISNSFKMYRSSIVKSIDIESRGGFEIGMEIVVKSYLKGYKITEVPSVWRDRVAGKSRFKLAKWAPEYLRWYFYAVRGVFKKPFRNTGSSKQK